MKRAKHEPDSPIVCKWCKKRILGRAVVYDTGKYGHPDCDNQLSEN